MLRIKPYSLLARSKRLQQALEWRGAAVRRALVHDGVASIDSYPTFGERIKAIMAEAGYILTRESNCPHWDGVDGYRIEFVRA